MNCQEISGKSKCAKQIAFVYCRPNLERAKNVPSERRIRTANSDAYSSSPNTKQESDGVSVPVVLGRQIERKPSIRDISQNSVQNDLAKDSKITSSKSQNALLQGSPKEVRNPLPQEVVNPRKMSENDQIQLDQVSDSEHRLARKVKQSHRWAGNTHEDFIDRQAPNRSDPYIGSEISDQKEIAKWFDDGDRNEAQSKRKELRKQR